MSDRLQKAIDRLPPHLQEEVADFAESLAQRAKAGPPTYLLLDWAGAAASLRDQYASGVEAAHDAMRIWSELAQPPERS